jgi:hypothetical protein
MVVYVLVRHQMKSDGGVFYTSPVNVGLTTKPEVVNEWVKADPANSFDELALLDAPEIDVEEFNTQVQRLIETFHAPLQLKPIKIKDGDILDA